MAASGRKLPAAAVRPRDAARGAEDDRHAAGVCVCAAGTALAGCPSSPARASTSEEHGGEKVTAVAPSAERVERQRWQRWIGRVGRDMRTVCGAVIGSAIQNSNLPQSTRLTTG